MSRILLSNSWKLIIQPIGKKYVKLISSAFGILVSSTMGTVPDIFPEVR